MIFFSLFLSRNNLDQATFLLSVLNIKKVQESTCKMSINVKNLLTRNVEIEKILLIKISRAALVY